MYGPPFPYYPYPYPQQPQRESIVEQIRTLKQTAKDLEEVLKDKDKKDEKKKGIGTVNVKLLDAVLFFFAFGGLLGIPLALFQISMMKHFLETVATMFK